MSEMNHIGGTSQEYSPWQVCRHLHNLDWFPSKKDPDVYKFYCGTFYECFELWIDTFFYAGRSGNPLFEEL